MRFPSRICSTVPPTERIALQDHPDGMRIVHEVGDVAFVEVRKVLTENLRVRTATVPSRHDATVLCAGSPSLERGMVSIPQPEEPTEVGAPTSIPVAPADAKAFASHHGTDRIVTVDHATDRNDDGRRRDGCLTTAAGRGIVKSCSK